MPSQLQSFVLGLALSILALAHKPQDDWHSSPSEQFPPSQSIDGGFGAPPPPQFSKPSWPTSEAFHHDGGFGHGQSYSAPAPWTTASYTASPTPSTDSWSSYTTTTTTTPSSSTPYTTTTTATTSSSCTYTIESSSLTPSPPPTTSTPSSSSSPQPNILPSSMIIDSPPSICPPWTHGTAIPTFLHNLPSSMLSAMPSWTGAPPPGWCKYKPFVMSTSGSGSSSGGSSLSTTTAIAAAESTGALASSGSASGAGSSSGAPTSSFMFKASPSPEPTYSGAASKVIGLGWDLFAASAFVVGLSLFWLRILG